MKILLASDGFVTSEVMEEALHSELPDAQLSSIASTWPVPPFENIGDVHEASGDEDALIDALQGCQAVMTHTFPFTTKVIKACPDLRFITVCRGGPVNVNIAAATEAGVLVANTPGRNATATAEHSVGIILAAMRQIAQRHTEVLNGQWRSDYYIFDNVGAEVGSSTIGVVGYGAVGRKVANIMAAFGGAVLVYDPWAKDRTGVSNICFVDTLEELLRASDVVTIHARVTEENKHFINASTIAMMPRGSVLINCARGSLVDYDAVCDALDAGHLFAAGFDCLPLEPLPADHRLLHTQHVTITPHLAGASKEAARLAARIAAADLKRFFNGELPLHAANPEVWQG